MQPGQQPVEDRALRLQIEALDIEHPAVAGLHQHGYPPFPGRLAHQELHIERVALLYHQVQPVEEAVQVLRRDALGDRHHPQVRVDLADPARRHHRLVHAQVEHAAGDAVEVGHLDVVEVGQPELSRQALHGQDVGDRVAGAQADHADPQGPLARLLGPGDLVAVAVEPQRPERPRSQQPHHGPAPGVVDPALGFVLQGGRRGRNEAGQLCALLLQTVDHLERGVLPQDPEHLALVPGSHIEHQRAPRLRLGVLGRHRAFVGALGTAGQLFRLLSQGHHLVR